MKRIAEMDKTDYYDKRFENLEKGHEKLHEKIDRVHGDMLERTTEIKGDLKVFTEQVKDHVSSDKKIAAEIEPLVEILPSLKDMVKDHAYKKERSRRWLEKVKTFSLYSGVIGTICGIVFGYIKAFH